MPQIHFVRHAQSENNLSNARIRAQEWESDAQMRAAIERARQPDPPLSALGRAQLPGLAARLGPLAAKPRTLLITSPMRRAIETVQAIAEAAGLAAITCEGDLYEVGGCHYCGHARPSSTAAQLEAEFPLRCQNVPAQGWFAGHTHSESGAEARARVARLIAWVETTLAGGAYDDLVIVAHGDLLTRWLRRWLGVPWGRELAIVHGNTGVTSLAWDARYGLQLRGLNDVSHLPAELRSGDRIEPWWTYVSPDLELRRYQGWSDLPAATRAQVERLRTEMLLAPREQAFDDYAVSDARSFHVVARAEGTLAGYVQYDPDSGRLRQLIVAESARGAGLGRRLVREVEDECRRQGRATLRAHAWVASRGFFAALGFEVRGEPVTGEGDARDWVAMGMELE